MKLAKFMLLSRNIRCTVIYPQRQNMKLTKFMLLSRNIRWTVICVIKANNEINEIYVIKAKFKILVIVNSWLFLYVQLLCFVTYFGVFVFAVIYFSENTNKTFW